MAHELNPSLELMDSQPLPLKRHWLVMTIILLLVYFFVTEVRDSYSMQGLASWYGGRDHGDRTANGETYNMYAMTAAHRRFPFGTVVRVTRLSNKKEVIVRINDRGPYIPGRIIDLSLAAAARLGMVKKGVAKVRLEILEMPEKPEKYKR